MNEHDHLPGDDDRRLHNYFERQAAHVDLPDGDATRVVARAARRRRTRRSAGGALTATVVMVGALGLYAGRTEQEVTVGPATEAPAATAPPVFNWTAVDVPVGLGWSSNDIVASDGSLYSLSTAPGRGDPNDMDALQQATLYRSADGRTWTQATLPAGFRSASLATSPGHLYAVGTAPGGGGGVDLVVATSTDGAATWAESRIPSPAAALKARYPDEVHVSAPRVAHGPAGLIAVVSVTAAPDAQPLLAAKGTEAPNGYGTTAAGVEVYAANTECAVAMGKPLPAPTMVPTTVPADPALGAMPPTTAAPSAAEDARKLELEQAIAAKDTASSDPTGTALPPAACRKEHPDVAMTYTWAQLGLAPELQALLAGEVHAYASTDGAAFTELTSGPLAGVTGGAPELVGSADGYRLLTSSNWSSTLAQTFSADGRTWTPTGSIDGWVQSSGHLGGASAVAVNGQSGLSILTAAPGGGWNTINLSAAIAAQAGGQSTYFPAMALGPLGLVAVASAQDGEHQRVLVVESVDGHAFTVRPLGNLGVAGDLVPLGVSMNADAVVVRLTKPNTSGDPSTGPIPPQRLLVGTRG